MTNPVRDLIQSAIESIDYRIGLHTVNIETYEDLLEAEQNAKDALIVQRAAYIAALPEGTEDDSEALNA